MFEEWIEIENTPGLREMLMDRDRVTSVLISGLGLVCGHYLSKVTSH